MLNPLQMNDWPMKPFIKLLIAIQFLFWGILMLESFGVQIYIVRQLLGIIYVLFIPGVLILRILRLHKLETVKTLLYCIGLSITLVMITGLVINAVYPQLGIIAPISPLPTIITVSIVVNVLFVIAYFRDKEYANSDGLLDLTALSPAVYCLLLLPFLSVFGTYLMNNYNFNGLLLAPVLILAFAIVLVGFRNTLSKDLYPVAVFSIALTLLLFGSLITSWLWGWDIHSEYYFSNLVLQNGFWNIQYSFYANSMLSIAMFPPIVSLVAGLDLVWVYKITYPLLLALVPLGLYYAYEQQVGHRSAFFAVIFFVSLAEFFTELLYIPRQILGELFVVLIILVIFDRQISRNVQAALFLVFAFSLVVSHYALSYIYVFLLLFVLLTPAAVAGVRRALGRADKSLPFRTNNAEKKRSAPLFRRDSVTRPVLIILFAMFAFAWYAYTASGSTLNIALGIGAHISNSLFTDLFDPNASQPLLLLGKATTSVWHDIDKYLYLFSQVLIAVGVLATLAKKGAAAMDREFKLLGYASFIMLACVIVLPQLAAQLNTSRFYQIATIALAPFLVVGGATLFSVEGPLRDFIKRPALRRGPNDNDLFFKVLSVFLAVFLLFNTGFVFDVVNKSISTSIVLNKDFDGPRFNTQEVVAAKWIGITKTNRPTYADTFRTLVLNEFDWRRTLTLPDNASRVLGNSYLYFGMLNIAQNNITQTQQTGTQATPEKLNIVDFTAGRDQIYDNGGARVYY